jgi:DMSO reductase anchor subunit
MLQLPLVLFIVMVEVSVGAVSVLVFLDWRNEVKRGFLISYAFIYLVLAGLTYLFQQNFATPALLNTYPQLAKAWTGQEALPLLLFFLLLLPYSIFLLLDKEAGVSEMKNMMEQEKQAAEQKRHASTLRILRLISGGATIIAGLVALFVLAMIFHPLAASAFGGLFTVASFFAGAFALGGVMTAMWLGHWYLVTPALSERPLLFSTTVVLVAILAQVAFSLAAGPNMLFGSQTTPSSHLVRVAVPISAPSHGSQIKPLDAPEIAPLSADAIGWLHILVGFVMPLVLGGLAWKLIRDRSFQSATGMLYLVVVCALAGEAMARGLFLYSIL